MATKTKLSHRQRLEVLRTEARSRLHAELIVWLDDESRVDRLLEAIEIYMRAIALEEQLPSR